MAKSRVFQGRITFFQVTYLRFSLYSYVRVYDWGCVIWTDCPGQDFYMFSVVSGLGIHNYTNDSHVVNGPNWYTSYLTWVSEIKITAENLTLQTISPDWNQIRVASAIG